MIRWQTATIVRIGMAVGGIAALGWLGAGAGKVWAGEEQRQTKSGPAVGKGEAEGPAASGGPSKPSGGVANAGAERGANPKLAAEVRRLVLQLDSAELSRRDAAEAELLKLGPEALELLPPAGERTKPALRSALERVRRGIERQAANAAMQATTATLSGEETTLAEALAAVAKQTGNGLSVDEETGKTKVGVKIEKMAFWQALDRIADAGGVRVYGYSEEGGLQLVPVAGKASPRFERACYSGPLRLEATEITLQRDLRSASEGKMRVGLHVAWEPRLRPITLVQKLDHVMAVDDQDHPIPVESEEGEIPVLVQPGSSEIEIELPFTLAARSATKIRSLRGKLQVLLPGKVEEFVFEGLKDAKKVEQRKAGATVTVDGVVKNNEIWEVRTRVKFDQAFQALDSHLSGWVLGNEATMIGPDKTPIVNAGFETTSRTEDEIGITYLFELKDGPEGHRFVYKTAATIFDVPVEYEFKDLMLP